MAGTSEGGKKTSEGGRGDPEKASPAAVEHHIKGIKFPADKKALLEQAKANKAPDDVLKVMQRFQEKTYNSVVEVAKEVGNVE